MNGFRFLFGFLVVLLARPACSDELRPGYLEMRQIGPGAYNLLFKVPARGKTFGSLSMSAFPTALKM